MQSGFIKRGFAVIYSLAVCFSEIGPGTLQIWTNTRRYDNRQQGGRGDFKGGDKAEH